MVRDAFEPKDVSDEDVELEVNSVAAFGIVVPLTDVTPGSVVIEPEAAFIGIN